MINFLAIFSAKYLIYVLVALFIIYLVRGRHELKKIITFTIFVLPTSYIVAKILSSFFYDARPFVINHFTPLLSHAADNGFPSDHSLLSFALASVIFCFNKKWGIAFFILGIIIGLSRVYVGIHWPVDILGSFVISVAVAFAYSLVLKWFHVKNTKV